MNAIGHSETRYKAQEVQNEIINQQIHKSEVTGEANDSKGEMADNEVVPEYEAVNQNKEDIYEAANKGINNEKGDQSKAECEDNISGGKTLNTIDSGAHVSNEVNIKDERGKTEAEEEIVTKCTNEFGKTEHKSRVEPSCPRIILITPETEQLDVTHESFTKPKKHRRLLKYAAGGSGSDGVLSPTREHLAGSPSRRHKKNNYSYDNPNFLDFKTSTQAYYQFLNRYHIGDTLPIFSRENLQYEVRKYGIDHINVGLFGQPGSGKSALSNSMYYAMTGIYREFSAERKTDCDENDFTSTTDRRLELRLTETIFILDNRGTNFSKSSLSEVVKQCEGFREAEEIVPENWHDTIGQKLKDSFSCCSKRQLFRNRIQCPIIVSSLKQEFQNKNMKNLARLINLACGCNPVVVLTHLDKIEEKGNDILQKRKREFEDLHCARIFALANYTYNDHNVRNATTDETLVEVLFNCCLVADQATASTIKTIDKSVCC